jgi:hypothetical protein
LRRAIEIDPAYANVYARIGELEAVAMADFAEAGAAGCIDRRRAWPIPTGPLRSRPDLPDGYVARSGHPLPQLWNWQGTHRPI